MSIHYEESNFDFDLDFLNPSSVKSVVSDNPERSEKSRKAILIAKKKIVATDSLIRRYYEKRDEVEQFERELQASKEECKQTCLDFKNITEKFSLLENEVLILRRNNAELEQKYNRSESLFGAIQSHANQLQTLVKDNETTIESLRIENQLQKSNAKDCENKAFSIQKENAELMKDICLMRDIISGKKKLNKHRKIILKKYEKCYASDDEDSALEGESDTDIDNNCLQQTAEIQNLSITGSFKIKTKGSSVTSRDDEHDSDHHELASADTGRGSSLASSDGEKCLNSPDYFLNHSPLNADEKDKRNYVDTATSPINFERDCQTSGSPITTIETIKIVLSPINGDENVEEDFPDDTEPPNYLSECPLLNTSGFIDTSAPLSVDHNIIKPIASKNEIGITENKQIEISRDEVLYSPDHCDSPENIDPEVSSNRLDCLDTCQTDDAVVEVALAKTETFNEIQRRELNNINNFDESSSGDCEVEMILDKMRFNRTLITPIPSTPSKSRNASVVREKVPKVSHGDNHSMCKEAAKLKEENKDLYEKYSKLEQDIRIIKDILMNKFTINNTSTNHGNNGIDDNTLRNVENSSINANSLQPLVEGNNELDKNRIESNTFQSSEVAHGPESLLPSISISSPTFEIVEDDVPLNQYDERGDSDSNMVKAKSNDITCHTNLREGLGLIGKSDDITPRKKNIRERLDFSDSSNDFTSHINDREGSDLIGNSNVMTCHENIREGLDLSETSSNITCHRNVREGLEIIGNNKHRKLSKLEKLRKKLVPKSKIKRNITPTIRTMRKKSKQLPLLKKVLVEDDTTAILNNKSAYEKAAQIMSELRSKQKSVQTKTKSPVKNNETNSKDTCTDSRDQNDNLSSPNKQNTVQCKKELVVAVVKCDEDRNCELSLSPPKKQIATRSRLKNLEEATKEKCVSESENILENSNIGKKSIRTPKKDANNETPNGTRKRQKRDSMDSPDVPCKRILRSSNISQPVSETSSVNIALNNGSKNDPSEEIIQVNGFKKASFENSPLSHDNNQSNNTVLNYGDLDIFTNVSNTGTPQIVKDVTAKVNPKEIVFCAMLDKYGKGPRKNCSAKVTESTIVSMSKTLQDHIADITQLDLTESKSRMNELIDTIKNWEFKQFVAALMLYLKDPGRKVELYSKLSSPPAPPMTKSEQVLLYVISQLSSCWPTKDVINYILCNVEYVLFKLNRTPEFDTIESMAHFYAILCRYYRMKSRLRLFMLDAMYCIQFKAVPLIKQCLDVWMHVLPLAHMGIAKSPLVTCLVYLLHFYKCEDRFNRVQEIRNILNRKYFYEITEWNEPKIIEMFRNAIKDVRGVPVEMKMLRIALIVIAKRHGAKWCQNKIIKNVLLPMLEKDVPERVKIFCISILGPLMKPYPVDMKVHCEIVINLLLDTLKQNPTPQMQEAIISSLIHMNKHNQNRVVQTLLTWKPERVSPQMEQLLRDFVAEKPLKVWKTVLFKIQLV